MTKNSLNQPLTSQYLSGSTCMVEWLSCSAGDLTVSTRGGESCWCDLERGRSTWGLRNRLMSGNELTDKSLNPEVKGWVLGGPSRELPATLRVDWLRPSPPAIPPAKLTLPISTAKMPSLFSSTGERPLVVLSAVLICLMTIPRGCEGT